MKRAWYQHRRFIGERRLRDGVGSYVAAMHVRLRHSLLPFIVAAALSATLTPPRALSLVWTSYGPPVTGPQQDGLRVNVLGFDPTRPHTLYAGTTLRGVRALVLVRRASCGAPTADTWRTVNSGLANLDVNALAINPTTPSTLYAGTYGGAFRSTDGGDSWIAVNNGLTNPYVFALAVNPITPSTLYAGTSEGGIFRSTDGGERWTAVLPNSEIDAFAIDPNTPSTIYAANGGLLVSTDSGSTWTAIDTAELAPSAVVAVAVSPTTPRTLYAGTYGGGIFRSTDGGNSWTTVDAGLSDLFVVVLASDPATPSTLYAGTSRCQVLAEPDCDGV